MDNNNNLVEHSIKIDDYIELRMKLPLVLDAMEFTAVLEKARKLMKLSEISIPARQRHVRNVDEKLSLVSDYEAIGKGGDYSPLLKKYDIKSVTSLQNKIHNIRKSLGIHKNGNGNGNATPNKYHKEYRKSSVDFMNKIIKMLDSGSSAPQVAKEMGVTGKKILDLVYQRTKKRMSDFPYYKNRRRG